MTETIETDLPDLGTPSIDGYVNGPSDLRITFSRIPEMERAEAVIAQITAALMVEIDLQTGTISYDFDRMENNELSLLFAPINNAELADLIVRRYLAATILAENEKRIPSKMDIRIQWN